MEFNITEIKRTFEEFNSDLDNILSADCDNYEYRLKQFFTRIDSVSVLKTIIKPFLYLELDEKHGLKETFHARVEYVIPETDEEEIACALQILKQLEENPNTLMTLVTRMYFKSSYNENISLFNHKIISPAFQKLKRKLQYKLEDLVAVNTPSVDSSKVMIINVGNINASNSTIGIGNDISQDVENAKAKRGKGKMKSVEDKDNQKKKVFIVHGRDDETRLEVTLFVKNLDFEPIILRDKESKGMTIIEKIEEYSDVDFAIVLYTPCDIGGLKEDVEKNFSASLKELEDSELLKSRARQNVVFEHGYLISKLGRKKVIALVKNGNIDIPNDYSGVIFISMEEANWKIELAKEMKAMGLPVDMNKIIS